jgi:hypothetical protein
LFDVLVLKIVLGVVFGVASSLVHDTP